MKIANSEGSQLSCALSLTRTLHVKWALLQPGSLALLKHLLFTGKREKPQEGGCGAKAKVTVLRQRTSVFGITSQP